MALSGALDSVVGRAVRDVTFREKFLSQPLAATEEAGYSLTNEDRQQLQALDREKAAAFFQKMSSQQAPMAWCSDHTCYEVEKPKP